MEKYKTIHEEIESAANRDVTKQVNISLVAVAVIVAGCCLGCGDDVRGSEQFHADFPVYGIDVVRVGRGG